MALSDAFGVDAARKNRLRMLDKFKNSKSYLMDDEEYAFAKQQGWTDAELAMSRPKPAAPPAPTAPAAQQPAARNPRAYRPGINGSYAPVTSPLLFAARDANVARMTDPNRPGGPTLNYLRGSAEDPNRRVSGQAFMRQMMDANREYGLRRQQMKSEADVGVAEQEAIGQRDLGATAAQAKAQADALATRGAFATAKMQDKTAQRGQDFTRETELARIASTERTEAGKAWYAWNENEAKLKNATELERMRLEAEQVKYMTAFITALGADNKRLRDLDEQKTATLVDKMTSLKARIPDLTGQEAASAASMLLTDTPEQVEKKILQNR